MSLRDLPRHGRTIAMVAAAILLAVARGPAQDSAAATAQDPAAAPAQESQNTLRFSLDWRLEGPAAMLLVPQDRGNFRDEGLGVIVDEGASSLEPITRVANGSYELGIADINMLIKYRDQNPAAPVKAIFIVYNKPPYAVVSRRSRGVSEPKHLEGKR